MRRQPAALEPLADGSGLPDYARFMIEELRRLGIARDVVSAILHSGTSAMASRRRPTILGRSYCRAPVDSSDPTTAIIGTRDLIRSRGRESAPAIRCTAPIRLGGWRPLHGSRINVVSVGDEAGGEG